MKVGNLKTLRQEHKLTQVVLAKKVGVTQPYIAAIEQGRRNPTLAVLRRLAHVLNVQTSTLLGEHTKKEGQSMQTQQVSESTVRRLAQRQGYLIRKSRRAQSIDNFGDYMLVDGRGNFVVIGRRYDATLLDIIEWLKED